MMDNWEKSRIELLDVCIKTLEDFLKENRDGVCQSDWFAKYALCLVRSIIFKAIKDQGSALEATALNDAEIILSKYSSHAESGGKVNIEKVIRDVSKEIAVYIRELNETYIPPEKKEEEFFEKKNDRGKPKINLVPAEAIIGIARAREFGINKYNGDRDGWRSVGWERYYNAACRHLLKCVYDAKTRDSESGLYHIDHALCNLAFISQIIHESEAYENKTN